MESDSGGIYLWNDDVALMGLIQVVINNNMAICNSIVAHQQEQDVLTSVEDILRPNQDFRHFPRKSIAIFCHDEDLPCTQRDYFGIPGDLTTPIFKDRSFEMMFCLLRLRVQRIFEDVMQVNHPFYTSNVDATGKMWASLEAKVLLPLKTFAYGVAPHVFPDYFSMSKPLAEKCCDKFSEIMQQLSSISAYSR